MQNLQNMQNMHNSKYAKYAKYAKYLLGHISANFHKICKNMGNTRTGPQDPSGCWGYFTNFDKICKICEQSTYFSDHVHILQIFGS